MISPSHFFLFLILFHTFTLSHCPHQNTKQWFNPAKFFCWFSLLFHTVCAPIFFVLPSLSLFLFVCIYHSAAPNLFKFMARHSTLIHMQQKYLSRWHASISGWSPFTPKSSCRTHRQSVIRRLDSSVTNAVVTILGITKNPSLLMFDIAFLIHTPIPNQRGNQKMDQRVFILLVPLPIHSW